MAMASVSGTDMSREQFLCSICLDVFCQPVTIACGHNFCKVCLTTYWNGSLSCQCPLCKTIYGQRPELSVNTLMSEMAAPFKRSPGQRPAVVPGEVPCDICPGAKCKAVKSCLVCLASFCKTHLEPHDRVATYKKHTLIDPVANLEDRMCKKHDKLLEIFCRSDQKYICVTCLHSEHKAHDTALLKEECDRGQAKLRKLRSTAQLTKCKREIKLQELKRLLAQNNVMAAEEKLEAIKVFSALVAAVRRSQVVLLEEIEERRRKVEKQACCFIKQLEKDITVLRRKIIELVELSSHAEDHHQFLQTFTSISSFPQVIDLDKVCVKGFQSLKPVWTDVAQLEEMLYGKLYALPKAKLRMVQESYAVEVTLDPATLKTGAGFILSEDGKQLRTTWISRMGNTSLDCSVLGKQGFRSCRFYYEVQVHGNTEWQLGVIEEAFKRDRNHREYWLLQLEMGRYSCQHRPGFYGLMQTTILPPSTNPKKIGVFVDYNGGQVSFYDENGKLFHSFTGCKFHEKLYPVLWSNDAKPLIIMPVKQKHFV